MILAIDIGNTNVSLGVMRDGRVVKTWQIETLPGKAKFNTKLKAVLSQVKRQCKPVESIVICSVVPKALKAVESIIRKELSLKPLVIGRSIKVPIKNQYRNPKQVGQDRLVCAYAAKVFYGAPCVVVDSGTAITFDVVSKKGDYLGGIIVPGIRLSAESLFKKTALLPKVKIIKPKEIIGRDTQNSILSGIFYGYGVLCDGLVKLISDKIKRKPKVIVTGGYVDILKKFVKKVDKVDKHLIFKGIYLVYKKSIKKKYENQL